MRDKLLDYLVGGLDSRESDQVRKALQEDPLLQQQLELLQTSLQPLETCRHYEPPADLKDRTLDFVAQSIEQQAGSGSTAPRRSSWTAGSSSPSVQLAGSAQAGSKWTILDVVVAGAILVTASLLFFPMIMNKFLQFWNFFYFTSCYLHLFIYDFLLNIFPIVVGYSA